MDAFRLSQRAQERASQVHVTREGIQFVMKYGRVIHSGEAIHYYLGRKDIPYCLQSNDRLMKLEGTTLITSFVGTIITLYKNKKGSLHLRRKSKWHRKI